MTSTTTREYGAPKPSSVPGVIFAGYKEMKKYVAGVLFVFLAACAVAPKKPEPEPDKSQEYITHQNRMLVDMCDQDNMPRYPRRPVIDKQKLKTLNPDDGSLDAYIQDYMDRQNKYIDILMNVILKTRQRVEQCR